VFEGDHLKVPRTLLYHPFYALSVDNYLLLKSIYNLEGVSLANMFNQTSVIEPLLEDRDNKGRTALHKASESGNLSQVIALLEQGAKLNAEDNDEKTPLHLAAQSGEKAVVRYLLKMGADVHGADSDHQQALHLAAQRGHEEVIFCLLLGGANINARDASGRTALHNAVVNGHEQVLKVLVKEGADLNITDENENTAWNLAFKGGLRTAQKLLLSPEQKRKLGAEMYQIIMAKDLTSLRQKLDRGLDPNFRTASRRTLLHHVVSGGGNNTDIKFSEMAKLLLNGGADVNARAVGGTTPLHIAVLNKDYATMEVLLEGGADVNAIDNNLVTPIQCTRDSHALKLLQAAPAQGGQRGLPVRQQGGRGEVSYPYSWGRACSTNGRTYREYFSYIFLGWELS
jgi:ankyrin repeat protein